MQVGFRPRLKARPSLVDLMVRSRQQRPPASSPSPAATPTSSNASAPLLPQLANQDLSPASLASEAQHIASTYQLPGSPSKQLQQRPATPLSQDSGLLEEPPNLPPRAYYSQSESGLDRPVREPSVSRKMASVSYIPSLQSIPVCPFLPHRHQAPQRAPCFGLPARGMEVTGTELTAGALAWHRNQQHKMASIQVSCRWKLCDAVISIPPDMLFYRQALLYLRVSPPRLPSRTESSLLQ